MKIDREKAVAFFEICSEKTQLSRFRDNISEYTDPELLAAIEQRLERIDELALSAALHIRKDDGSLTGRVWESVRIYEELLKLKHGRRQAAGYTRRSIKVYGEVEAVRRTVALRKSSGLDLLAKYNRLDCAYEQIVLDFPDAFDAGTQAIARATLERIASKET